MTGYRLYWVIVHLIGLLSGPAASFLARSKASFHPTIRFLSSRYTIEYSLNFHRHVIRKDGRVTESFEFLDEALQQYPGARRIPIKLPASDESTVTVAGIGLHDECTITIGDRQNMTEIQCILEDRLKWMPSQTTELLNTAPSLQRMPSRTLRERLDFLLSPLPDPDILMLANETQLDWPLLLDQGRGVGMSIGQLSHALKTLPTLFLALDPFDQIDDLNLLSFLYTVTPAVVLEMATGQITALIGASKLDVAAYAFLHWSGWEWQQCRLLIEAIPTAINVPTEPSWELYDRNRHLRKELRVDALWYLRLRLQIRPSDVFALMRTHTQVAQYDMKRFRESLDALQRHVGLSSQELRVVILKMPSLLGASGSSIESKTLFWTQKVGLLAEQLCAIVQHQPSLLQYSLGDNLEGKLAFFTMELGISTSQLIDITLKRPEIWGRSTDKSLRPMLEGFLKKCEGQATPSDFGQLLAIAPELAMYNWGGNLAPKISYIKDSFDMSGDEIRQVLLRSPRVLAQSLRPSLETKIRLLRSIGDPYAKRVVLENPSILQSSASQLKARIEKRRDTGVEDNSSMLKSKRIVMIEPVRKEILKEFPSVADAAKEAGKSTSHMYAILRSKKVIEGKMYVRESDLVRQADESENQDGSLVDDLRQKIHLEDEYQRPNPRELRIFVTGRAYPPETEVRGRRRSGGMALRFETITKEEWKSLCGTLWKGQRYRVFSSSASVMLGYSYSRPSRQRCSLYAMREAFRAASHIVSLRSSFSRVIIATDSHYAYEMLSNSTAVERWGTYKRQVDFVYDGSGPAYRASPDILYPTAVSYYRLAVEQNVKVVVERAPRVTKTLKLGEKAKLAATLMYDKV